MVQDFAFSVYGICNPCNYIFFGPVKWVSEDRKEGSLTYCTTYNIKSNINLASH